MSAVVDEDLDFDLKAEMASWLECRDQQVLEQLREDGFAFAARPGAVPGNGDFTDFLPHVCPHLVVCAPALVVEDVERIYDNLPNRQSGDGMRIKVETAFSPSPGAWFRGAVRFVYTAQVVRSRVGNRIGVMIDTGNEIVGRDKYGTRVAHYDKGTGTTRNIFGTELAEGNTLAALIMESRKPGC